MTNESPLTESECENLLTTKAGRIALVEAFFSVTPTPTQQDIIDNIFFYRPKRLAISAYTRYGKSWSVAIGVLLYIYFHEKKKIQLIAPIQSQTAILRNYIAAFTINSPLEALIETGTGGSVAERLKREASKSRITFKNGCEMKTLSAEGSATRLMGWGGDLIIMDESCLIDYNTYLEKIHRMLGDSADSQLVEIGNPWHREGQFWKHWIDPAFTKIHIPWTVGVEEQRTRQAFIDEARRDLSDVQFDILYNATFPEDTEDTLIRWKWIQEALARDLSENVKEGELVAGLDVAEMGNDFTVLTIARNKGNFYKVENIHAWRWKEEMETVGLVREKIENNMEMQINVDATGCGHGVWSRFKELGFNAKEIKVGRASEMRVNELDVANQKAEFYWRLRTLFYDGMMDIPQNKELINQLNGMKYKQMSGKIVIIDPGKSRDPRLRNQPKQPIQSPDYADSLMLCVSKPSFEPILMFA
jgi:hypothetical protein